MAAEFSAIDEEIVHQRQGLWGTEWVMQIIGKLSANITRVTPIKAGTIVHRNADGELECGCAGSHVAATLYSRGDGFDVAIVSSALRPHFHVSMPTGNLGALNHIQGFEIETTQFDLDNADDFEINDLLHSPTEAQAAADVEQAGLLFRAKNWTGGGDGALTLYTDHICGIVSDVVREARNGTQWLSYYAVNIMSATN